MKKIIGAITAAICALCTISIQSPISDISVSALSWSDELSYGDYLKYQKFDRDEDGTYDYIEITDCDESATEIEIPGEIDGVKVTEISSYAFWYCENLTSVNIPNSVTSIGRGAFDETALLKNQTGVKYVDKWVVDCDEDVTTVEIKDGTRSIADYAFERCTNLTNINIPNSVTFIDEGAFYNCINLSDIEVAAENENYSSIDGVLFNKDKTDLIKCPVGNLRTEYTIPDNVTSIGYCAFYECKNLLNIIIPDSVTEMGILAFGRCDKLTNIKIPNGVTKISSELFEGCTSLANISVPENIVEIEGQPFGGTAFINAQKGIKYFGDWVVECDSDLTNAEIKPGTIGIADYAFSSCKNLEGVTIPDGVTKMGRCAFSWCENLTNITIPSSIMEIDAFTFASCKNLARVIIKNPECIIYDEKGTISNGYNSVDFVNYYYFDGTIYSYENSTAQAYAEKYGYKFEALEPENEIVSGDITGNGKIDLYDAIDICKYIMGMKTFTEEEMKIADFDGNGKVDLYDVIGIAKTLLG